MLSRTLALLRKEKGINQRDAAAALGVSQAVLSHYENGLREPSLAFVIKLADYYHVSTDFLLGRTEIRNENRHKELFNSILTTLNEVNKKITTYSMKEDN